MRTLAALVGLCLLLAGCANKTSGVSLPAPTAPTLNTYHDKKYGFSFTYPDGYKPGKPHVLSENGVPTYIVDITTPKNEAGLRVTVDKDVIPFPPFPEGKVALQGNGPDTLHYHHAHVSGWPAMQIERFNGKTMDAIFTIANTRTLSYQIQMITGTPPFSSSVMNGYFTIVKSMKVPFS